MGKEKNIGLIYYYLKANILIEEKMEKEKNIFMVD